MPSLPESSRDNICNSLNTTFHGVNNVSIKIKYIHYFNLFFNKSDKNSQHIWSNKLQLLYYSHINIYSGRKTL